MHIGIDLGGTKTEIIVMDQDHSIHHRKRVPSPQGDYQATLENLLKLIDEAEETCTAQCSIGIGIPGSLDQNHRIKNANSTWLIGRGLKSDIENALGRSVMLANDADCFTLSEATDGSGQEAQTVFGVILGTGVGGGFVRNKQTFKGANSIAGEWGHNPLPLYSQTQIEDAWGQGRAIDCYCGQKNCIETFLSGPAMSKRFALDDDSETTILSSQEIVDRYLHCDKKAVEYFNKYVDQLARSLAMVINIVDPDVIVLGGGLSKVEPLYHLLPEAVKPYIFSSGNVPDSLRTNILPPKHGDASGVRGAAWIGRSIESPQKI